MKQRELTEMLTTVYLQLHTGQCPKHYFISIRGRIRQQSHRYGYSFPDIDRDAKMLAKNRQIA